MKSLHELDGNESLKQRSPLLTCQPHPPAFIPGPLFSACIHNRARRSCEGSSSCKAKTISTNCNLSRHWFLCFTPILLTHSSLTFNRTPTGCEWRWKRLCRFFLFLPEPCQLICFHLKADVGTLPWQQFYTVPYDAMTRCDECNQLRQWWQATRSCIPRRPKEAASAFLLDYPQPFISIREQMSCRAARRSAQTNGEWDSLLWRELPSRRRGHRRYIVHPRGYWLINKLDTNYTLKEKGRSL